jgi:hypothetical protein
MINKIKLKKLRDTYRSRYSIPQHELYPVVFNEFVYWNQIFIQSNNNKNKHIYKIDFIKKKIYIIQDYKY